MEYGCVYLIKNVTNGKIYIGKTRLSAYVRLKRHFLNAERLKQNTRLYGAIRKYGSSNFTVEVLKQFDDIETKQLDIWEQIFISKHRSMNPEVGYNMTSGGEGGAYLSEEVRGRMSKSIKESHKLIRKELSQIKKQQFIDNPDYKKRNDDTLKKAREKRSLNLLLSKNKKKK